MALLFEVLNDTHRLEGFSSGEKSVDDWLVRRARFNQNERLTQTIVLTDQGAVFGYYAMCTAAIQREELARPMKIQGLPAIIPLLLLARLGVDKRRQGEGLGKRLLWNALLRSRSISRSVGAHGVVVHALNVDSARFYRHFGFLDLPTQPGTLILPMSDIERTTGQ